MTGTDRDGAPAGVTRGELARAGRWLRRSGLPLGAAVCALTLAGLGLPATELAAQEAQVVSIRSGSGWLGVNVHVMTSTERPEGVITLLDVLAGSPASEAGLKPGDRVVRLNGVPVTADRFRSLTSRLEAGDPIAVTVVREDQEVEVSVVAGRRPAPAQIVAVRLQEELDSVRSRFVRILEAPAPGDVGSSGTHLARFTAPTIRVENVGADSIATRILIQTQGSAGVSGVFVETPEGVHRAQLIELSGVAATQPTLEMERMALALEQRARDAQGATQAPAPSPAWVPMRREALKTAEREQARLQARQQEVAWPTRSIEEVRPLSPYVAGLTRVAGADLRSLKPGLGQYFGVDQGLLVTEVAEGTPAALAGLRGGDVIVAAGGQEVTTLGQLRELLATGGGGVLDVVRAGERISVTLR